MFTQLQLHTELYNLLNAEEYKTKFMNQSRKFKRKRPKCWCRRNRRFDFFPSLGQNGSGRAFLIFIQIFKGKITKIYLGPSLLTGISNIELKVNLSKLHFNVLLMHTFFCQKLLKNFTKQFPHLQSKEDQRARSVKIFDKEEKEGWQGL